MSTSIQVSVQLVAKALAASGGPFVMEGGQLFMKWDSIGVHWQEPLSPFRSHGTLVLTFHHEGKEVGSLSVENFDPGTMTAQFVGVEGKSRVELK